MEASSFFESENHQALSDPRTHLIVGDGRSHLLLSTQQYDVIISEPSNPWIAGVASLFTREFFRVRAHASRLAASSVSGLTPTMISERAICGRSLRPSRRSSRTARRGW